MKKLTYIFLLCLFLGACQSESHAKKIGIVIPIEHKALNEIIEGFKESLQNETKTPVQFKIANAQGDMNIERASLAQMKLDNTDMIVPIGMDATEMALATNPQQTIVSLASSYSQKEREQLKSCHIAIVHDEIPAEKILQFIHLTYPTLTKLVLIHSASEKVFPEVKETVAVAKKYGIEVKPIMAATLNDLYSTVNAMPSDTQGIFVLKDSLIISGISTLERSADTRKIPLITSDQGSVQDGAAFALGVHERDIGIEGGKLAAAILKGQNPCTLPITTMTHLTVFVNRDSVNKSNQHLDALQQAASTQKYNIEYVKE